MVFPPVAWLVVLALAAMPGRPLPAQGGSGTLVNATEQRWRVRRHDVLEPKVRCRLALQDPDQAPWRGILEPGAKDPPEVDLGPGAELAIAHDASQGRTVDCWLEFQESPGPPAGQGSSAKASQAPGPASVIEGFLHLRTGPAWLPLPAWWNDPDPTTLGGDFYPVHGRSNPFRLRQDGDARLVLEPRGDWGCLIQ